MYYLFICLFSVEIMTDFRYPPRSDCVACAYKTSHEPGCRRAYTFFRRNLGLPKKTIEEIMTQ